MESAFNNNEALIVHLLYYGNSPELKEAVGYTIAQISNMTGWTQYRIKRLLAATPPPMDPNSTPLT